jgi:phytoene dehydrogenase-like protein
VYENKGTILTSERIKRIIIDNGTAKGVEMEDGRIILSKMGIVSSINPNQTFLELVGEKYLDKEFIEKIKGWKWEKWSLFGIHMAIDGIPKFKSSYPEIGNALLYIIGYDNPDDIIRHWNSIENGNLMDRGGFNLSFPSLHDPTQAPNGKNTGVISQFAPYLGDIWYKIREEHAERCIDLLKEYIDINILFKYPVTPLDIENKFADMKYGSIKQGAYTPFQMGFFRPNEESSQTITPVKNLYLAGASCHPGGMITLGPGYLAANAILSELGVERWWKEPEYIKKAKEKGVLL